MFSSRRLGLFDAVPCPDLHTCKRNPCIFSHKPGLPEPAVVRAPVTLNTTDNVSSTPDCGTKSALKSKTPGQVSSVSVPAKRPMITSSISSDSSATRWTSSQTSTPEPPRKVQRLDTTKKRLPNPTNYPKLTTGEPFLNVTPATSKVPIPIRQTCLKSLYDCFVKLYAAFHPDHPHLAHDHSLAQETDVYNKTNKQTYRQAIVTSIVSLKKRVIPTSPDHDSVGTEAACQARANSRTLTVTAKHLECALLVPEQLEKWGYVVGIPDGPGGDRPHDEGSEKVCERCSQRFVVARPNQDNAEACSYHWARPYTTTVNGEKIRTYKCCAMVHPGPGCTNGPHVFNEKIPEDLHRRHPFSLSSHPTRTSREADDNVLDVAAMDCEMVYTTGGMRVARVSVVDGDGKEVFDEFVRMDDGVEVIDYNTQFSGVTSELLASAALDLAAVRRALRVLIGPQTILIGHALENDLKTLRMVHLRVIDTSILFPHRAGLPYRRALRDLASDHLKRMIQTGGATAGHSSVEDAVATLDLVRWWIVNERPTSEKSTSSTR